MAATPIVNRISAMDETSTLVYEIGVRRWNQDESHQREYFMIGQNVCYEIGDDDMTDNEAYEDALALEECLSSLGNELWEEFCNLPHDDNEGDDDELYQAWLADKATREGQC